MGCVSIYSSDHAEVICARLEAGEPLAAICRDKTMPGIRTVLRWADERQDFGGDARHRLVAADCCQRLTSFEARTDDFREVR